MAECSPGRDPSSPPAASERMPPLNLPVPSSTGEEGGKWIARLSFGDGAAETVLLTPVMFVDNTGGGVQAGDQMGHGRWVATK